ncbi:MAG: hypothetical protein ACTSPV_13610 [Candidatus Hodarchaeales archaeon]
MKLRFGVPFETSGCKGCNRPYANCRPSEIIRNFPFKPAREDLELIPAQIQEYDITGIMTQ